MQSRRVNRLIVAGLTLVSLGCLPAVASGAVQPVQFDLVGRTPAIGPQQTGGVAYHPPTKSLFVANRPQRRVDVFDLSDPANPQPKPPIVLGPNIAGTPSGVAVSTACGGIVAVAVPDQFRTVGGMTYFYRPDGTPKYTRTDHLPNGPVTVPTPFGTGAGPKHMAFLPGRHTLLIASEGRPGNNGNDVDGWATRVHWHQCEPSIKQIRFGFGGAPTPIEPDVRRFAPFGPDSYNDLEPEYVTSTGSGRIAYVSLQENNAVAVIDVAKGRFVGVRSVGATDRSQRQNAFDASDTDGIDIRTFANVHSLRQPSAIAAYEVGGQTFIATANQGAPRNYDFSTEEHRVKGLPLDPTAFPDAATLQKNAHLGRLNVSTLVGDTDDDGDYDRLYSFGGRSMSILDHDARPVWDSEAQIEQWTAANSPATFNTSATPGSPVDDRSDDRGPEPKAITVGLISGRRYALLATAQQGDLFAWDLSDQPGAARLAGHISTRETDLGPDSVRFIPSYDSPNGRNLVLVTSAATGATTIYRVKAR